MGGYSFGKPDYKSAYTRSSSSRPNDKKNTRSSRSALEDGIKSILPLPQNPLHSIAHYHFRRFGKLLRGRTALKVSKFVRIEPSAALNWALAVELMHNASLVHDDICDQDESRHDYPTIFSAFGTPSAVCFGDWLVARSFELAIKSVSSDKGVAAIESLAAAMRFLSEGQSSEFNQIPILDWSAYEEVVSKNDTTFASADRGAATNVWPEGVFTVCAARCACNGPRIPNIQ